MILLKILLLCSPSRVHTKSNTAMKLQRFSWLFYQSDWCKLMKAKQRFDGVLFIFQFSHFTASQSNGVFLHSLEKCKLLHHKGKPARGRHHRRRLLLLVLLLLQSPTQEVTYILRFLTGADSVYSSEEPLQSSLESCQDWPFTPQPKQTAPVG